MSMAIEIKIFGFGDEPPPSFAGKNHLSLDIETPATPWSLLQQSPEKPPMVCLQIDAGKKRKIRPGDILGALTGSEGVAGRQVGKIHIADHSSFVAVERNAARVALRKLVKSGVKGRPVRARRVGGG